MNFYFYTITVHICKDDSTARTAAKQTKIMSTIETPSMKPSLMTPATTSTVASLNFSRLNRRLMNRQGEMPHSAAC